MALGGILGAVGGSTVGKAVVEVIGDSSKLQSDLQKAKSTSSSSTTAMGKDTGKFSKVATAAYLAVGAAVVAFAASSVKAFMEAQKVTAQTEAVIRSTGGAANVTKDQVLNMAGSLRDLSGVEDEAIQSGANMLLTFTNIRNEVGAGNAIFDQATKATLNLSVAMGKDMQSSAILVGKALNDPVKGMTALNKAGIQFTADQKETIATMVKTGDVMGAQKIILAELETQFGGSAAAAGDTFAGKMKILASQIGDVQEQVGGFIVSGLTPLVNGFVSLPGPIKTVAVAVIGLTALLVAAGAVVRVVRSSTEALGLSFVGAGGKAVLFGKSLGQLGLLGGRFAAAAALSIPIVKGLSTSAGDMAREFEVSEGRVEDMRTQLDTFIRTGLFTNRVSDAIRTYKQVVQEATQAGIPLEDVNERLNKGWNKSVAVLGGFSGNIAGFRDALRGTLGITTDVTGATKKLAVAHLAAAQGARDQLNAELALGGGFLGIASAVDSATDAENGLAAARAEVTRLTKEGKTNSDEYADAVEAVDDAARGSLESQLTLAGAVQKYAQEVGDSEISQQEAINRLKDFGQKAGLSAGEISGLVAQVKEAIRNYKALPPGVRTTFETPGLETYVNKIQSLKNKLDAIPKTVTTRFVIIGQEINPRPGGQVAAGGILAGQAGFITRGPTMLVGESRKMTFAGRGAEAVIPFDQRGIGILAQALAMAIGRTSPARGGGGRTVIQPVNFDGATFIGDRDIPHLIAMGLGQLRRRYQSS